MVTQRGENTYVIGIEGNFDDAQTGVKKMFSDAALAEEMNEAGYQFSSANSINIGRLVPQVVYYVYSYATLLARGEISDGEQINVVVPTGNFGNILAASYAKQMGVPIAKLICASNENKVLFDFFTTGCYDRNRDFILTTSPSMDILISSNLERLIYQTAGRDAEKNNEFMKELNTNGVYTITGTMQQKKRQHRPSKKFTIKQITSLIPTQRQQHLFTKNMKKKQAIPQKRLSHLQQAHINLQEAS